MELEEKLKVVAEYDDNIKHCGKKGNFTHIYIHVSGKMYHKKHFQYHTSFDWSVPVYSKAIKEAKSLMVNYVFFAVMSYQCIKNDDKLAFFDNLVNLILKLQKAKQ